MNKAIEIEVFRNFVVSPDYKNKRLAQRYYYRALIVGGDNVRKAKNSIIKGNLTMFNTYLDMALYHVCPTTQEDNLKSILQFELNNFSGLEVEDETLSKIDQTLNALIENIYGCDTPIKLEVENVSKSSAKFRVKIINF
ncbi:hypothetical protein Molly5_57 [Maribacter phage Molly_5]|uniref:Uncharacterized protein n=2 Tax=Mollyvirus TaxID=2948826 RepID=A0A8E4XVQ4_9CAUD|nr:hypothetical protein M1M29_gp057 [Maribacter phage Molly_1]YP_010357304.1 hypothetical protein M1M30_gp055 [Maribacter phage Colly_1]QQO97741.1 hypothetical protein Molly2_57 [Maribacter phage Molly_2]QQO97941.1 hypothetical protein Molly3_57 [Maribacter phage Molly_3]QQO98141.1 hypothetical protein Molly4_57 [Maribacter phage Molly_4]QQO98341.1 hypothetical protein Molly5_57 [Maribacter phage Molly_5]QQO97339.1 hypothetical protein Colly1_55 [Maribacter phage Colly_1]